MIKILYVQRLFPPAHCPRNLDIAHRRKRRQEVEFLKNKSDSVFAQPRALGVVERGKIHPVDHHAPLRGPRQPAQQVKERGLAGTGRAHNRHKFSAFHSQRNPANCRDLNSSRHVNLGQVFGENDRR